MPHALDSINLSSPQLRASPRDRYDAGRAARQRVPLEAHAELAGGTRNDPLTILADQDQTRLSDLIPLRYGRMSRTPFTFLRGAAAVMASDLAAGLRTDLHVELCGDAHLGNFRWYRAPDRQLVFDLNDFDETLPGPFEWDLKRLAASIMICGRHNGFSEEKCRTATRATIRYYREFMATAAEMSPLDLFYYRIDSTMVLQKIEKRGKKQRKWKEEVLQKAGRRNSLRAFHKLTDVIDGRRVIVTDPPLVVRVDQHLQAEEAAHVSEFYAQYHQSLPLDRQLLMDRFALVDVARKIVGVGSVGTRCLILLLEAGDGTPLFMQFKQAVPSVLERHLGPSAFEQSGQRVVEGQRMIQATSDTLLGWARWRGGDDQDIDFYFRQLWDGKGKIDVEQLGPKRLATFAGLCGKTLAFAHARSGDAMTLHGYMGEDQVFDDLLVEFAAHYADLTERDHAQLVAAIEDGALEVVCDL
ncbi:MAG: DUF2252 domain-containing protein [Planctomycetota bacterium]